MLFTDGTDYTDSQSGKQSVIRTVREQYLLVG